MNNCSYFIVRFSFFISFQGYPEPFLAGKMGLTNMCLQPVG